MTDNEIIQVLKDCSESCGGKCKLCPIFHECVQNDCFLDKQTLDLINRQKAEIERLQRENCILSINADTAFQDGLNEAQDLYAEEVKEQVKAKAIKEFAERLKFEIINTPFMVNCTGENDDFKEGCLRGLVAKQNNIIDMIDTALKEMVGEVNEGIKTVSDMWGSTYNRICLW